MENVFNTVKTVGDENGWSDDTRLAAVLFFLDDLVREGKITTEALDTNLREYAAIPVDN